MLDLIKKYPITSALTIGLISFYVVFWTLVKIDKAKSPCPPEYRSWSREVYRNGEILVIECYNREWKMERIKP